MDYTLTAHTAYQRARRFPAAKTLQAVGKAAIDPFVQAGPGNVGPRRRKRSRHHIAGNGKRANALFTKPDGKISVIRTDIGHRRPFRHERSDCPKAFR